MSTSPKKPYQSQIDALSKRLDPQDEWFGEIEFKLDHLIQASEKSLMQGPPQASPHIATNFTVRSNDHHKWLMYKPCQQEESESEESESELHSRLFD